VRDVGVGARGRVVVVVSSLDVVYGQRPEHIDECGCSFCVALADLIALVEAAETTVMLYDMGLLRVSDTIPSLDALSVALARVKGGRP
jgi:hypothetical protein